MAQPDSMDLSIGEDIARRVRTEATEVVAASISAGIDSGADSPAPPQRDQTQEQEYLTGDGTPPPNGVVTSLVTGNVLPAAGAESPAGEESPCAREDGETIRKRFIAEGRWREISRLRDRMMVEAKKAIPDKEARRAWVYAELDKMYPPVQTADREIRTYGDETDIISESPHLSPLIPTKAPSLTDGQIQGLSSIPKDWPELPANASLAIEVGWVQANRLRIVTERPGGATVVKLDMALSPAPSWAALGWLETSIRSYAKFVDVAAKVSGGAEEEGAVMKRERKSLEEVRALLDEMMQEGDA